MLHLVDFTGNHLAVEVGDLVGAQLTRSGAELLEHLLEGHLLAVEPAVALLQRLYPGIFLARLALAQEKEAVVLARDVEHGADVLSLANAQAIGQQLY